MGKITPLTKIMLYQSVGFLAIIAFTCFNELVALLSLIWGSQPFIADFRDTSFKILLVLMVWFLVACSTRRLLARMRYLEGFMRICAWCHHIDSKGNWVSMEDFLQQSFDTPTTHGICPICLAKQKEANLRSKAARAAAAAAAAAVEAEAKPQVQ